MTTWNLYRIVLVGLMGPLALARTMAADVPPRTEAGQTLVVPADELKLGEVYYVTPGEDTQVTCTSDALLQRVVATSSRAVGYFVTPFDTDENHPPILAGALRIPVASLKTGWRQYDELLRGAELFAAAEYPEVTFCISRTRDSKLVSDEKRRQTFNLSIAGELTVKQKTLEIEAPCEVKLIPFTWQTMLRNVGELLILRTKLDLPLADLGLQKPMPQYRDRVADTIHVEIFLVGNTMSPEKLLDPQIKPAQHTGQTRFLTLVRDLNDVDKGYAFGRAYLREIWDDAPALNRLAAAVLSEDGIETRDLGFVLKAAQRANELTAFKDAAFLDTYAGVYAEKAEWETCLKWAREAVAHLEGVNPERAEEIRAALARWEGRAKQSPE
jgi:hypothetical protein